jgi:hypothetical protein
MTEPKSSNSQNNLFEIFLFWLPLALMSVMMTIEQPVNAAVLARMDNPKESLAAFGVCFSLGLMLNSPIVQLLTTTNALAKGRASYNTLLKFSWILMGALVFIHIGLAVSPLFSVIVERWIGAPKEIVEPSRQAFLICFPWAAAVGLRRYYQGILIGAGQSGLVAVLMVSRLVVTFSVLILGYYYLPLPGASLGALALTCGVISGAVCTWLFVRIKVLPDLLSKEGPPLSVSELIQFYVPLSMTSVVNLIVRPLLTVGLARAAFPLESLAVWPVLIGYVGFFRSFSFGYQETVVALLKSYEDFLRLRRFVVFLFLFTSGMMLAMSMSEPACSWWFQTFSGLDEQLYNFALQPLFLLCLIPGLSGLISWYRGLFVSVRKTGVISRSVFVNASVLIVIMFTLPEFVEWPGLMIAGLSFMGSLLAEVCFLSWLVPKDEKIKQMIEERFGT